MPGSLLQLVWDPRTVSVHHATQTIPKMLNANKLRTQDIEFTLVGEQI